MSQIYQDLSSLPFGEIYVAAELKPLQKSDRSERPFYVTNAPRLFTEPTDSPPNEPFRSIAMKGLSSVRQVTKKSSFTGSSTYNQGSLVVANSEIGGLSELFEDWRSLIWNGQPIVLKVGGRIQHDGSPYPYSSYLPYFTGVIDAVHPLPDGKLEITFAGNKIFCEQPVITEFYRAFGGAVRIPAAHKLSSTVISAFNVPAVTVEWFGVVRDLPVTDGCLLRHSNGDYGITVDSAGALGMIHTGSTRITSTYVVTAGEPLTTAQTIGANISGGYDLRLYAGRDGADLELVDEATIGSFSASDAGIVASKIGGTGIDLDLWEGRVFSSARTLKEIRTEADSPISDPGNRADLVEAWKFGDGTGTVALGAKEVSDLVLSDASILWVSSLEGDDPEQFGGSILGRSKPDGWGVLFNVLATPVDSQRHDFQLTRSALTDLLRLKISGAPMVPDETIQGAKSGALTIAAATSSVTLDESAPTAHRLIPGQSDPPRDGQQVELVDTVSNDGTYQVAVDGISADGQTVVLEAVGGGASGLVDESAPSGALMRTPTASVQYTYDLPSGTVSTPATPVGDLTADIVGQLGASARVSEVFEAIVGEAPTNLLTFDPVIGAYIPAGASPKQCGLLDAVMRSGLGWWIENRAGGYTIGNYTLPSGNASAALLGSRASQVGATTDLPSILGRITKLVSERVVTPSWMLKGGYDRTWHTHDRGAVSGSVPTSVRDRLSADPPFRIVPMCFPDTRKEFPTSEPLRLIETYISTRGDMETYLKLAADLFTEARRWAEITVAGLGLLAIDLNDVVLIEHPNPAHDLAIPRLARVVSMIEDASSDLIQVGVFF